MNQAVNVLHLACLLLLLSDLGQVPAEIQVTLQVW